MFTHARILQYSTYIHTFQTKFPLVSKYPMSRSLRRLKGSIGSPASFVCPNTKKSTTEIQQVEYRVPCPQAKHTDGGYCARGCRKVIEEGKRARQQAQVGRVHFVYRLRLVGCVERNTKKQPPKAKHGRGCTRIPHVLMRYSRTTASKKRTVWVLLGLRRQCKTRVRRSQCSSLCCHVSVLLFPEDHHRHRHFVVFCCLPSPTRPITSPQTIAPHNQHQQKVFQKLVWFRSRC